MAINDGIGNDVRDPFPGIRLPSGTGAPGSAGAGPETSQGPEVGRPVVSVPGASSQVPSSVPVLPVTSGDTSGMSSDSPVNPSAFQGPAAGQMSTGAGAGSPAHYPRRPGQQPNGRA